MKGNKVFVFGNPDLGMDSIPLRILPRLRERFPVVDFLVLDPNEEWDPPDPLLVLDTVLGVPEVTVFRGIASFSAVPTVSLHDFDALTNLRYLAKLGKLGEVTVIGVPPEYSEDAAFQGVARELALLC